jgi:hypothetical protein
VGGRSVAQIHHRPILLWKWLIVGYLMVIEEALTARNWHSLPVRGCYCLARQRWNRTTLSTTTAYGFRLIIFA